MIDEQIIQQCQNGDQQAFRKIVQSYQRLVFSIALRMLCDEDNAKDATQATFIKVWQNIRSYDIRYKFQTWVYTIAVRICLDELKKSNRLDPMPEDESYFKEYADDVSPERKLENSEMVSVIKTLTNNLSPKQRMVFTLIYLENLESSEVQQITGMTADQVKSNLSIAKKQIKEQLKQLGYDR